MAEGGMACRPTALPPLCRRTGAWPLHRPCMAVARGVQSLCTGGADIPHKTSHGTTADNRADPAKRNAPKWRVRKGFPHGGVSSPTAKIPPKPSPYFIISLAFFRENACFFQPISLFLQTSHPFTLSPLYIYT